MPDLIPQSHVRSRAVRVIVETPSKIFEENANTDRQRPKPDSGTEIPMLVFGRIARRFLYPEELGGHSGEAQRAGWSLNRPGLVANATEQIIQRCEPIQAADLLADTIGAQ